MRNSVPKDASELEAVEQREWRESLEYVIQQGDRGRVQRLLASLRHHARMSGVSLPFTAVTAYVKSDGITPSARILRSLNGLLALAMIVFAAVQYNDPDGPLWAVYYGVPALLALVAGFRYRLLQRFRWLGVLWAWVFAGEHPGGAALIGGSLVLVALIANEALAPPPVKSVLKNA